MTFSILRSPPQISSWGNRCIYFVSFQQSHSVKWCASRYSPQLLYPFSNSSNESSIHRKNIRRKERALDNHENYTEVERRKTLLTLCILGPPNAGKSTLFNRLLCKEANRSYRLTVDKHKAKGKNGKHQSHVKKSRTQSLIGRSNFGNQTGGLAIVSATAGTTRDRRECIGRIGGTVFKLWDTAGVEGALTSQQLLLEEKKLKKLNDVDNKLRYDMMNQTVQAAIESDLVLLVLDAKSAGVTSDLLETAKWLRKISKRKVNDRMDDDNSEQAIPKNIIRSKPSILVLANKLEGEHWNHEGSQALENLKEAEKKLGFGEVIPISAQHGEGMADIAAAIEKLERTIVLEQKNASEQESNDGWYAEQEKLIDEDYELEKPLRLAILGRQNVGKSTLVNALLKKDRVIVGATPGLTRDAIAVDWYWHGRPLQLVDTAGIRKRPNRDHSDDIEDFAVQDALRAMKVADVAVIVLDAGARMLQRQELAIADAILREGRALVIVANKMDLIVETDYSKEEFSSAVRDQLESRFPILRKTPIIPMSSLTGECVDDLMPFVFDARDRWAQTISTGKLNGWLKEVLIGQSPPLVSGKPIKIRYILQKKGRPPTFMLFCNTDKIPDSYSRYLIRHFQDTFQMYGMEVRFIVRKSATTNPYNVSGTPSRGGFGVGGHLAQRKRRRISLVNKFKDRSTLEKYKRQRSKRRDKAFR